MLTNSEITLLEWLQKGDGQYGECYGKTLDGLIYRDLVVLQGAESGTANGFIARGADIMFRAVSITDAGRTALSLSSTHRGPTEPLQCLRCGTVDAFGPVSKEKK